MIGTAAGLALAGKLPFASTFAIFETGRAWEQIRQSICYPNLNVRLVASHGGITVGEDGASHQSTEDITVMRVLPNMTVIVPADATETVAIINAIADYKGPVYVRLGRAKVPVIFGEDYRFKIGSAYVLSLGKDVNILATGIMVSEALRAAEILRDEKVDAGVINISTIKPLDGETVLKAAKTSRAIVTAEEHSIIGGLGSAVAEFLSEVFPVLVWRVGIKDRFGCSGTPEGLMKLYEITAEDIVVAAREAMSKKR